MVNLVKDIAPHLPLIRTYKADEAIQGVAVDERHFYAINNTAIGKYERGSGRKAGAWQSSKEVPLIHMDGGVVVRGRLFCSHSNFPETPMQSSIEIFDPQTLRHVGSQSFGQDNGSLTWVDWNAGFWWVCFGHYNGKGGEPNKPNTRTSLVRYDSEWRRRGGYTFPPDVIARWDGMTASGGVWGPGDLLYVTSHHAPEFYVFRLPRAGSVLKLVRIVASPAEGQGIALDPSRRRFFQIQRKERAVYEFDLSPLLRLLSRA